MTATIDAAQRQKLRELHARLEVAGNGAALTARPAAEREFAEVVRVVLPPLLDALDVLEQKVEEARSARAADQEKIAYWKRECEDEAARHNSTRQHLHRLGEEMDAMKKQPTGGPPIAQGTPSGLKIDQRGTFEGRLAAIERGIDLMYGFHACDETEECPVCALWKESKEARGVR